MPKTIVRKKKAKAPDTDLGEWVDIDTLNPFYKNPRQGDVEKVAESLKAHGQIKPIGVNRGSKTGRPNEILYGNHTWKAAKSLRWKQIWVKWFDVNDIKAKKLMLADNGSTDGAGYDESILAQVLLDIKDAGESLVGTTYTDDTLSKLVRNTENESAPHSNVERIEDAPDSLDGVDDLAEGVFFPSDLPYDIPPLIPEMIPEEAPEPLDVYAGIELDGKDVREDWEDVWWYQMWHAGSRGINWSKAIPFFYCVDDQTETLTKRGWVTGYDLREDDTILSMRPDGVLAWSSVKSIFRKQYSGKMHHITKNNIDALVTPNHKFPLIDGSLVPIEKLGTHDVLRTFGSGESGDGEIYSDQFVELVGWAVTEGHYMPDSNGIVITQKAGTPTECQIRQVIKRCGIEASESRQGTNCTGFYIPASFGKKIRQVAPSRVLSMEFILSLSASQRLLLVDTMVAGDGWNSSASRTRCYTQKDWANTEAFITLCALAGIPTSVSSRHIKGGWGNGPVFVVNLKVEKTAHVRSLNFHGGRGDFRKGINNFPVEDYEGLVWCPTTEYGTFVVRRNGIVYVTGNTDDFHFDPVYNNPAQNTKKILNLGIRMAVMPNYTIYQEMPIALWVYSAYRSYYVARYFQEAGIQVIPDIQTGGYDEVLNLSLVGIPENAGVVSAQVQMARGDKSFIRQEARLLKEAEDRLNFKSIIIYGHTDADEVVERADFSCKVIRVAARTARRREYLNAEATINTQKVKVKKKRKVVKR